MFEKHISHSWHWTTACLALLGPLFLLVAPPADGRAFDAPAMAMEMGRQVHPPEAFLQFCRRSPNDCATYEDRRIEPVLELRQVGGVQALVEVSAGPPAGGQIQIGRDGALADERTAWRVIAAINEQINRAISPRYDSQIYGVSDYWATPLEAGGRTGDCEDYALEKRRALIEAGMPRADLALAMALTPAGEDHVVLLIRVSGREYALDNLTDRIISWNEAPYRWVQRQVSGASPQWVTILPARDNGLGESFYASIFH